MADNTQNTNTNTTNSFNKGLIKDPADSFVGEGLWTHARNAVNNSTEGQLGLLGNEPATTLCKYVPYTIIGSIYLGGEDWIIFSTDNFNSEIGKFNEKDCTYSKLVNAPCLNFKTSNLIKAAVKSNFDCTSSVYWDDGINPTRVLNVDNIPYKEKPRKNTGTECYVAEYTTDLDCEALRLAPLLKTPCVNLSKGKTGGIMPNGSYQVVIAYSINGIKVTDYFLPSNIQSLFSHSDVSGSLEVEIESIDEDFDEFELVVISYVKENITARKVGNYSTRTKKIFIDKLDAAAVVVGVDRIPLRTPSYEKSDGLYDLNDYLIRVGIYTKPDFNYQPQANKIEAKWVAVEVPSNYYVKGGNEVSYLRDEVYSFFIRWVYNTGEKSASYHIPGRASQGRDTSNAGGTDAIETREGGGLVKKWQVSDTSKILNKSTSTLEGVGTIVAQGEMAYWESTERYPDNNPAIWGDLCGKPIRHHKMPDNSTTHIYNLENDAIVLLGVKFEGITHPLDNDDNPISSIVGYEILRGSREGNKTVIAKGLLSNMAEYDIDPDVSSRKGLYANYPFNDLSADPFLSKKPVKGGCEGKGYTSMGSFRNDLFSFHSPDTQFRDPFLNPYELKIHGEVFGTVEGSFSPVYRHPQHKLIKDFAVFCAAIIGVGVGILSIKGRTTTGTAKDPKRSLDTGLTMTIGGFANGQLVNTPLGGSLGEGTINTSQTTEQLVPTENRTLMAAQAAFTFTYFMGAGMDEALRTIRFMLPYQQYAYQYNAHGLYNNYITPTPGNIRRKVVDAQYINPYIQDFGPTERINNLFRSRFVALRIEDTLENPSTKDNSRVTIGMLSQWDNPTRPFSRTTSSHYSSLKIQLPSQYGQLDGIMQVPVSGCTYYTSGEKDIRYTSPVLFGGDTYINRYTEKNAFFFFNDWLMGQPDGFTYDYMQYVNVPYPRYWMDSSDYDSSRLIAPLAKIAVGVFGGAALGQLIGNIIQNAASSAAGTIGGTAGNIVGTATTIGGVVGGLAMGTISLADWKSQVLANDYFHLDRRKSDCTGKVGFGVRDAFFYVFANGVRDFFVESEINLAQRDWDEETARRHYDQYTYTDLKSLFRSDIIKAGNYYKYDYSLSANRMFNNFISWGNLVPRDFDPLVSEKCFSYYPSRAIYSLPTQDELKRDNWRFFLANNYYDFGSTVTTIKGVNQSGALILYADASPNLFAGVDQLQTNNGIKVTIGDGGLFGTPMQATSNAEHLYEYGACQSVYGVINTPAGLFWISQNQGKVFQYGGQGALKEISRNGMKFWFAKYLPSQLLLQFPDFELKDNIASGVAASLTYDNVNDILYVCKKDYVVRDEYKANVVYDGGNRFRYLNQLIYLGDSRIFEDASFTISYDVKTEAWISFHDWHPDFVIPSKRHFLTVKDKGIYRHNDRCDLFCNFYGVDYPFEVEFVSQTGQTVTTMKNVEYQLECYKYDKTCQDKNHILDYNFDRAVIHNTEQSSGDLKLVLRPKNDPMSIIDYPIIKANNIDILYSKEENKYRFNQFWDATRNRGEYKENYTPMWQTAANGYDKVLNEAYHNYQRSLTQHKKIRHYLNKILLKRMKCDDVKMLFRLSNAKVTNSFR